MHTSHYEKGKLMIFFARAVLYEPFVMGGSPYRHVRYQVKGEEIKINTEFQGFVAEQKGKWNVFEKITGGLCGNGKSKEDAINNAKHNLSITPSFKKQCEKLGPIDNLPEEETESILRKLKVTS